MNSAILNFTILVSGSAMLESDTLLSSLGFTQKHSPSILTLTQTNSIWFKLIHSHSTWLWQPSWFLPSWTWLSWNRPSQFFLSNTLTLAKIGSTICTKKPSLIHSHSTSWWQLSWILPSWIWPSWTSAILVCPFKLTHTCQDLGSHHLHSNTNFSHISLPTIWHKLIQTDSNSFILSELDNGNHLEFCHVGFRLLTSVEFRHIVYLFSDSLKYILPPIWLWLILIQSDSNSFILTYLDDGSHLGFCHLGFSFCIVEFRHLVFFSQIHSKTLSLQSDSDLY